MPPVTRRFVFLLLEDFTLLCFSCAVEALQDRQSDGRQELYSWVVVGENGDIRADRRAGIEFKLDMGLGEVQRDDTVMICGGMERAGGQQQEDRQLAASRGPAQGVTMAGLCTAGYTLAKAGLLDGKRATIHWENQDSFVEDFDEVDADQVGLRDGRQPHHHRGRHRVD